MEIVCPEDNLSTSIKDKDLISFPKNYALIEVIEKDNLLISKESQFSSNNNKQIISDKSINDSFTSNDLQNLCNVHHKKLEVICFDCNDKICLMCGLFGVHKKHQVKEIKQYFKEKEEYFKNLKKIHKDIEAR